MRGDRPGARMNAVPLQRHMSVDYPRDLIGYGRPPPHPHWPGDAHIAVQFVLNYEEGSENNVLEGGRGSETFLSEMTGATAFPNRHMSMESLYEYGSRAGLWRRDRVARIALAELPAHQSDGRAGQRHEIRVTGGISLGRSVLRPPT